MTKSRYDGKTPEQIERMRELGRRRNERYRSKLVGCFKTLYQIPLSQETVSILSQDNIKARFGTELVPEVLAKIIEQYAQRVQRGSEL